MGIKHTTTATKDDEVGAEVNKTEWNADHTIDGNVDFGTFDALNIGNLGIGTSTPTHALELVGDADFGFTATIADEHALEIDVDAAGFGDVKAFDVDYITGAIASGAAEGVILVNVDESAATGGDVFGLEILTTTEGATDHIIGLKLGIGIDPIDQFSGTFGNADSILNKAVDVLAALSSGGAGNISVFVADNDTITIGDAAKFEEIEFIIDTGASGGGVAPTFEFSTGVGTWTTFTPTDGTNGFKNTGEVLFDEADIPTWAVGTGTEFLIRITRTRNTLTTTPILDLIQISAVTVYKWDKDGLITGSSLYLTEKAAASADVAGDGQFWVKTATPNLPMFTNDAGTDLELATDFIPARATSWYGTAINSTGSATILAVADVLRAFPFIVKAGYSIDRIQFDVTTLAAGNCIVGIYDSTSALYPNAKITEGTAQSTGTTGLKTDTISQALTTDTLYWLVYNADAAPIFRGVSVNAVPTVLGNDGTAAFNRANVGWTVARSYDGTLPATFTGSGTLMTGNVIPLILVRAS